MASRIVWLLAMFEQENPPSSARRLASWMISACASSTAFFRGVGIVSISSRNMLAARSDMPDRNSSRIAGAAADSATASFSTAHSEINTPSVAGSTRTRSSR